MSQAWPEAIVAEDDMEKGHYMNHDLKMDILMMAHNCAHHPSIAQTTRNVAALAWFPGVKTYTTEYFDSCSICLPRRKAHRSVGPGSYNCGRPTAAFSFVPGLLRLTIRVS